MPRTKMGTLPRVATKAERVELLIRTAFALKGIYSQKDMAKAIEANEATISRALNGKCTKQLICRIHAVVGFKPEELEELLCAK